MSAKPEAVDVEAEQVEQVEAVALVKLTANTMQAVIDYLTERPYKEVANLIGTAMSEINRHS